MGCARRRCTERPCALCWALLGAQALPAMGGWFNRAARARALLRAGAGSRRRRRARTSLRCPRGWSPSCRARRCTPVSAGSVAADAACVGMVEEVQWIPGGARERGPKSKLRGSPTEPSAAEPSPAAAPPLPPQTPPPRASRCCGRRAPSTCGRGARGAPATCRWSTSGSWNTAPPRTPLRSASRTRSC